MRLWLSVAIIIFIKWIEDIVNYYAIEGILKLEIKIGTLGYFYQRIYSKR
jgi:hypothetical protein